MEGHPRDEDPGATDAPGDLDSFEASKRVFLSLEREHRLHAAALRPWWRLRGRYEDLSLVIMLARLERDCLAQPRPHPSGSDPSGQGGEPGGGLAEWAKPWGAAPWVRLDAEIGRFDRARQRTRRWLSGRAAAQGETRARERLGTITTELEERDPKEPAAFVAKPEERDPKEPAAVVAETGATKSRGFERPERIRVAAVGALFSVIVGVGVFLFASHTGSGPEGSSGDRDAMAGVSQHLWPPDVHVRGEAGPRSRGEGQLGPLSHPGNQGSGRAGPETAGRRTPATSEAAPVSSATAPPEPPVPQPTAQPQPVAAPAAPSSTSSQAKSTAAGCPPEFGYEC